MDDTKQVELEYPRIVGRPKYLQISLTDVRAADDIRVFYDFERDGWVIEQASIFEWLLGDTMCDPDWAEVAFIQAWAREKK